MSRTFPFVGLAFRRCGSLFVIFSSLGFHFGPLSIFFFPRFSFFGLAAFSVAYPTEFQDSIVMFFRPAFSQVSMPFIVHLQLFGMCLFPFFFFVLYRSMFLDRQFFVALAAFRFLASSIRHMLEHGRIFVAIRDSQSSLLVVFSPLVIMPPPLFCES